MAHREHHHPGHHMRQLLLPTALFSVLFLGLLLPSQAHSSETLSTYIEGEFGIGEIDKDLFIHLGGRANLFYQKLAIGLQIPLRFKLSNHSPSEPETLRAEDWDEPSDYARIIRFARWENSDKTFRIKLGELAGATIGHGSILNNYLNGADLDHFQLGLDSEWHLLIGGAELMIDNLIAPEIIGARLHLRPWELLAPQSPLGDASVGLSLIVDTAAPLNPTLDPSGKLTADDANNLLFNTQPVFVLGTDLAFIITESESFSLEPYLDGNTLFTQERGFGLHSGLLSEINLQSSPLKRISIQLEYQRLGTHYHPQYVGPLYEIQRQIYPLPSGELNSISPTQQQSATSENTQRHGGMGHLSLQFKNGASLQTSYQDQEGEQKGSFLALIRIPFFRYFKAGLFYTRVAIEKPSDVLDLNGALLQSNLQINAWSFLHLFLNNDLSWRLIHSENGTPNYGVIQNWSVGFNASFHL